MVSVRRVVPVLLLVMAVPALAARPKQSSHPPRELHRVGDHFTAYNPPDPATYPPSAKTYAIKHGDTLWALAKQFYGNAYLWPQLWESNTWITDAHWIYPGDVLLVEGEVSNASTTTTTAAGTVSTAGGAAAGTGAETTLAGGNPVPGAAQETDLNTGAALGTIVPAALTSAPIPLGTDADLYCYGYIGDPNEPMPNFIESFEDVEMLYQPGALEQTNGVSQGDLIFISGGTSTGIVAGETYIIVEPGELVKHPRTGETLGRHWDFRGQVRVLCADDTRARAIISQSCKEVHAGARLKPLPQLPIPIARIPEIAGFCDPPSGKVSGYIVQSDGWDFGLGVGNLLQINLGRDDQIQPGDFLTVYRESPVRGQPRQILGEIGILTTENHTATARVVSMRRTMEIGDRVEAR
ncbi:MAG TPA: LysM peptidoglycan-binding domain-containing protein [Thermoanaerobaculia bacterium]|nr:LysM peptidoglycan-binding domain-containing protein [Thermoanaerobaculia bacterium]